MFQQILDIISPPKTTDVKALQEKPDYTLAIIGSVSLIVVVLVIFIILKKK